MPYKCAYGCTSYDPCCDGCDGEVSDQSTGWAEPAKDTANRFKAALRGKTLYEYIEDDDEDDF